MPTTRPEIVSTMAIGMDGTCKPDKVIPDPITTPTAAKRRRRSHDPDVVEGASCFKAGSTRTVARGSTGTRPRKTQRHPTRFATILGRIVATARPSNAGPNMIRTSPSVSRRCRGFHTLSEIEARFSLYSRCKGLVRDIGIFIFLTTGGVRNHASISQYQYVTKCGFK